MISDNRSRPADHGLEASQDFEFGQFRLDRSRRLLIDAAGSGPIRLPHRVFETLAYLVERAGALVTKEALMKSVWPDIVVEENSLSRNISILRKALGEKPAEHRFILTVPGRGYRFVAAVNARAANDGAAPEATSAHKARPEASAANDLYLQAQALWVVSSEDNLRGALHLLSQAIDLDPQLTCAWSAMATVCGTCVINDYPMADALSKSETLARRALELDPDHTPAYKALGCAAALRGRFVEAEEIFRRADMATDPIARIYHALFVTQAAGHLSRALQESLEAHRFTTVLQGSATLAAVSCLLMNEDNEALRWSQEGTATGYPAIAPHTDIRAQLAFRAGRFEDAAALLKAGCTPSVRAAGAADAIDLVCAALPDHQLRPRAVSALQALEGRLLPPDMDQTTRKRLLLWYTMLGAVDCAHDLMDRTLTHYAQRGFVGGAWGWLWITELRPFRQHPRFQEAARRLGLLSYWEAHGAPDGYSLRRGKLVEAQV